VSAPSHKKGLRTVAALEAAKGVIASAASSGLFSLIGGNAGRAAEQLVTRLHLNPAHHYPHLFITKVAALSHAQLVAITALVVLYSAVRFIEAFGLWQQYRWAEWLAALSGGIYVPFELYELALHATWLKTATLAVNLGIVGYMVWLLTERIRQRRSTSA